MVSGSRLPPGDRELALVHPQVAEALVAAVDAPVRVGWNRVSDDMQWATRARLGTSARLTSDPCHVHPAWNAPPPAGTSTGTRSGSTPARAAAARISPSGSAGP